MENFFRFEFLEVHHEIFYELPFFCDCETLREALEVSKSFRNAIEREHILVGADKPQVIIESMAREKWQASYDSILKTVRSRRIKCYLFPPFDLQLDDEFTGILTADQILLKSTTRIVLPMIMKGSKEALDLNAKEFIHLML